MKYFFPYIFDQALIHSGVSSRVVMALAISLVVLALGCSRTVIARSFEFPEDRAFPEKTYRVFLRFEGALGRQFPETTDKSITMILETGGGAELLRRTYSIRAGHLDGYVDWVQRDGLLSGFVVRVRDLSASQPARAILSTSFTNHQGRWLEITNSH